ncbi:solute carrier family 35 member F5-like isoform X4 [Lampetra planeri]
MDGGRAGPMQTRRRMLLGIGVLLLVDFIWVASSELTWYIYTEFNKPFFSTFVKTSLFSFYLLGFVLWPPWRRACAQGCPTQSREPLYVPVEDNEEDNTTGERPSEGAAGPAEGAATPAECRTPLLQDSVSAEGPPPGNRKLSVAQVAKLSFSFCFVWFLANFSYQQALAYTHVAIVNIISSTSGLFTLVLAAFLPSSSNDRFSLSKLLAVLLSIGGVLLVSLSTVASSSAEAVMAGSIWSLLGALLYATYLVLLQRSVGGDRQLDIPMFFGFVGLFNLLCLWPGFPLLHYAGFETFVFPSNTVWAYILINGLGLLSDHIPHGHPCPEPHHPTLHRHRHLHSEGEFLLALFSGRHADFPLVFWDRSPQPLQQLGPCRRPGDEGSGAALFTQTAPQVSISAWQITRRHCPDIEVDP